MHSVSRVLATVILLAAMAPAPVLAFGSSTNSTSTTSTSSSAADYAAAEKKVKAEKYADAIVLLDKVVKADPKNADAYNYLGFSYRKLGRMDEALGYYEKALALNPKHRGANEYLGELYLEMKQVDKAKERLDVLSTACNGCEEYVELKKKIDTYKAGS
jgi:tetratricopeptide (TPR) repeat protein